MSISKTTKARLGTILSLVIIVSTSALAQTPAQPLVLLNWAKFMDPALVEKFEHMHNVDIREIYFESDEMRDHMILDTSGKVYDLAIVNGPMLAPYLKRGWLAPATEKEIPNLSLIGDPWLDAFAGARGHATPYFWGTLGIAYRADLVPSMPVSWMDLLKPAEQVRGKIMMIDSKRDALAMALKGLGYSANSVDNTEIDQAIALLLSQKPYVHSYSYLNIDESSALVKGDVAMAMMFNGDALILQQHHEQIHYVVPEEGGNIWTDYIVVMADSKNKEMAYEFINFLNNPENAAQLAEYVYCATPNKSAEMLMSSKFLENPIIYPTKTMLSKSEAYEPLPPRARKTLNTAFARLIY